MVAMCTHMLAGVHKLTQLQNWMEL